MTQPVKKETLEKKAAESTYTKDELVDLADDLREAIQQRLNDHFESCHLRGGDSYWLVEESGGVWLGFTKFGLAREIRNINSEFDEEALLLVADAYLDDFQNGGYTIAIPGPVARSLTDAFHYPIFVPYPDGWQEGNYFAFQRIAELVSRFDMTPAEALDFWVVAIQDTDSIEWAGYRDVDPEAVRKNVRQAREKYNDPELGATHENGNIHIVPIDEIPEDKPHDEENDLFYIPTEADGAQ